MSNRLTLFKSEDLSSDANQGWRESMSFKFSIVIVTIMICSLFFVTRTLQDKSQISTNISPGYIWNDETIIAEYSFSIQRELKEYQNEVKEAESNALQVFTLKTDFDQEAVINQFINNLEIESDNNSFKNDIKSQLSNFLNNIYSSGYIEKEMSDIKNDKIVVKSSDNYQELVLLNKLNDFSSLNENFERSFSPLYSEDILNQIRSNVISKLKPNLIFDEKSTDTNIEIAKDNVPKTNGIVRKGELIISQGDKINKNHIQKIKSYNKSEYLMDKQDHDLLPVIGSLLHLLIVLSIMMLYIVRLRKDIFKDNFHVLLISSFIVFVAFLAWLSINLNYEFPIQYLILMPAISMLATVIYDSKTSFYLTVTMSLMVAGIRNNDHTMGLTMLFAGLMAILSVRDIQNRSQVYQSILYILLGISIPIVVFGFERMETWIEIAQKIGFAGINAALSPLTTFGILFLIERSTTLSTDLRIQEFDNLNHPLLIKMNEVAPGTYQHSLGVSSLSERCAMAIGANTLFCRVAPYFHDIGKIEKAEYFAENQINMDNKHDLISPIKSAQIIKNHVSNGAKMARAANLPDRIIDVIYMHHGTSLIKHFYAKAVENDGKDNVNIEDYMYPGPKPNTKENAIIMICDAAEAISRLGNKTKEELDKMIGDIINGCIAQGQFDNCDITAQDLATIKTTISKNLLGMIHKRVDYKKIETEDAQ